MKNLLAILFSVLFFLPAAQGQENKNTKAKRPPLTIPERFNFLTGLNVRIHRGWLEPVNISHCGRTVYIWDRSNFTDYLDSLDNVFAASKWRFNPNLSYKTYTDNDLHYLPLNAILEQISALKR